MIDWSISLGNLITTVITLAGFVFGGIGAYYAIKNQLTTLSGLLATFGGRMINMENELKKLNEVMLALAVQDERMSSITHRVDRQETQIDSLRQRADHMMQRIGRPPES